VQEGELMIATTTSSASATGRSSFDVDMSGVNGTTNQSLRGSEDNETPSQVGSQSRSSSRKSSQQQQQIVDSGNQTDGEQSRVETGE